MTRSVSYGPSITMSMGSNRLRDLAEPSSASDAATKNYVDGHTSGGSSSAAATPALTLSTGNSIGTSTSFVASDATVAVFNLLGPVAQAFGDTSLTGSAAFAARQDHRHPMPATPVTGINKTGSSPITGSVTFSEGTNITITQAGHDLSIASTATSTGSPAVPALTLSTANSIGTSLSFVASNATVALFDTTNPSTQAFGDAAAVGTAAVAARRDHKHAMPASPAAAIGSTALVYRYTVAGTDKATIDTGVDTPDAGSNDWTNGDLLEVRAVIRTDNVAAIDASGVNIVVNNDATGIYSRHVMRATNTTLLGAFAGAESSWVFEAHGNGGSASIPSMVELTIPDYLGTVLHKVGRLATNIPDATAGNNAQEVWSVRYAATTAITRLAINAGGSQKFKVGSQLLIYKRLAA